MRFVIEHGVHQEELALALARRLFAEFDEAIDTLALLPVADDSLALTLDDECLYTTSAVTGPPSLGEIMGSLRQRGLLAPLPT